MVILLVGYNTKTISVYCKVKQISMLMLLETKNTKLTTK